MQQLENSSIAPFPGIEKLAAYRTELWESLWDCAAARRAASQLLAQNTGDTQLVSYALGFLRQLEQWRRDILETLGLPEEAIVAINQCLRLLESLPIPPEAADNLLRNPECWSTELATRKQ